jgi:hypothetical protein
MPFVQKRMVEVVSGIARHPELLHDSTRANVSDRRDRDDLVQLEHVETVSQDGPSAFGRISFAPMRHVQPPSDLDAGLKGRVVPGRREPDESGERRHPGNLGGPESVAVPLEVEVRALSELVALRSGEGRRKVLHHPRVRVQGRERIEVAPPPTPQQEALGSNLHATRLPGLRQGSIPNRTCPVPCVARRERWPTTWR